jgi:hypothetical protein
MAGPAAIDRRTGPRRWTRKPGSASTPVPIRRPLHGLLSLQPTTGGRPTNHACGHPAGPPGQTRGFSAQMLRGRRERALELDVSLSGAPSGAVCTRSGASITTGTGVVRWVAVSSRSDSPCPPGSGLPVATTSDGLPFLDLRLMARAGRAREGPRRHVGSARLRAAGAGRLDARHERLGDGRGKAADPRRLDLANPLALLGAPLALPLGVFGHPFLS